MKSTDPDSVVAAPLPSGCGVLMTAKAQVVWGDQTIETTLFFDQGSQRSFISNNLKQKLNLKGKSKEILNVYSFGTDSPQTIETDRVRFNVLLNDGSKQKIMANSVPRIAPRQKLPNLSESDLKTIAKIPKKDLADSMVTKETSQPEILISSDFFWEFMIAQKPTRLPSGILLIPTKLGLMLSGANRSEKNRNLITNCCVFRVGCDDHEVSVSSDEPKFHSNEKLDIEKLWSLDHIGISDDPKQTEDDFALEQFNKTARVKSNGQPEVGWPWVTEKPDLPTNLAYGRFKSQAKKFTDNPEMYEQYRKIMNDQLSLGMIEPAPDEPQGPVHYLPHHCVSKPDSETTKYRVVFDGSAKQRQADNSLNDVLYRGPINLPQLVGLLMNFRMAKYAITADIEKAFLKLALREEDRDCCRFLWYDDPAKPHIVENNIRILRFAVVPVGIVSSPFLLEATLRFLLESENNEIATKISRSLYQTIKSQRDHGCRYRKTSYRFL